MRIQLFLSGLNTTVFSSLLLHQLTMSGNCSAHVNTELCWICFYTFHFHAVGSLLWLFFVCLFVSVAVLFDTSKYQIQIVGSIQQLELLEGPSIEAGVPL